jgi:hypothetical protein
MSYQQLYSLFQIKSKWTKRKWKWEEEVEEEVKEEEEVEEEGKEEEKE